MRVVVRYLPRCQGQLDAWVATLPGADPARRRFARVFLRGVAELLVATQGSPPGVRPVPGYSPPACRWQFATDWWLEYAVVEVRRGFRRPVRRVIVVRVFPGGPG